ncbi:hypothetical protein MKX08_004010 [Trichoderma sp. CBMAI-0020]|nr:hypothetical protein MKX08_004010 [Trichoderma sp. CBMAI-0020]
MGPLRPVRERPALSQLPQAPFQGAFGASYRREEPIACGSVSKGAVARDQAANKRTRCNDIQPPSTSAQAWRSQPARPETSKALSANPPPGFVESAALYEYVSECYFERPVDAFADPLHTGRDAAHLEVSVMETTGRRNGRISTCQWPTDGQWTVDEDAGKLPRQLQPEATSERETKASTAGPWRPLSCSQLSSCPLV